MNAECEASNVPKPLTLHCILHQEALCGKSVDMSCVMNPVITVKTFANFICCQSLEHEQDSEFPLLCAKKILGDLKEQFSDRFSVSDVHFKAIWIFLNPLSCEIKDVQPSLQLELTDLQANEIMKGKFKEGSLVQFYNFLPE
ncbi:hypothetical protein PR048_016305 [Dryococelus australis]|uniref:Uncharacterized protein n=1 Tax=Dryococelus australis TaxID=614101 RepID=A0ABQ9HJD0_9NEOP|nr:hypothetical protein PR048_016305 [Dryococelus australis]